MLLGSYSCRCAVCFLTLIYAAGEQTMLQNALLEFGFVYRLSYSEVLHATFTNGKLNANSPVCTTVP